MSKVVEFHCGRLLYDQQTKKVTPDNSKGKIRLELNEDNELNFEWINLSQGNEVQIQRYLFVNDATFEKVQNQKRVYILKFQTDTDVFFFWMQSKDQNTDESYCQQINQLIQQQFSNDQPMQEEQKQQQQPQQSLPQPLQPKPQPQQQQQQQQNNWLNPNLMQQLMQQMQGKQQKVINLSDVLNSEFLRQVSMDEDYLNQILLLLPEEQRDPDYVRDNLLSPQFLQAVDQLEAALRSPERSGVLASLELDPSILQQEFDGIMAMLLAIKRKVQQEQQLQ